MEVRHAPYCTYRIRYHMVFVMKYRKNLISEEVFDLLKTVSQGITERYYLYFEAIGSDGDHLHIVVEGAPRYSPSRIMQICKSIFAIEVFRKFPEIKEKELWGGEFWSDGGHIDTVGDSRGLEEVKKYVLAQGWDIKQMKLHEFV